MKNYDIISAAELAEIADQHGAIKIWLDGKFPKTVSCAADLGFDKKDRFMVVLNYKYQVQFHLITKDTSGRDTIEGGKYGEEEGFRAVITTGLRGRCENFRWVA